MVAVFGSSQTVQGSFEWEEAFTLGRYLGDAGVDVATGGYAGTMEAVSAGAASVGAEVVGITADRLFPDRGGANRHVTRVRDHPTVAARIADLVDTSDGAIALPGSLGTATELMVGWNRRMVGPFPDPPMWPLIAVGSPWKVLIPELARMLDAPAEAVTIVADAATAGTLMVENLC